MSNTLTQTEASAVKASRKINKAINLPYEIREGFGYLLKYGKESKFDIARTVVSRCPYTDGIKVIKAIEVAREFMSQNCA
jgi:hypothetical protein